MTGKARTVEPAMRSECSDFRGIRTAVCDWQGKWFNSILPPRFKWAHFGPTSIDAPVADQESSVATLHMREIRMREIRQKAL